MFGITLGNSDKEPDKVRITRDKEEGQTCPARVSEIRLRGWLCPT
jgi:hypothetical protein